MHEFSVSGEWKYMNPKMQAISSAYRGDNICPICHISVTSLGEHIRDTHGEEEFRRAALAAKAGGMPDPEIGSRFGITFRQLEKFITETYGVNISALEKPKKIKHWMEDFKEEPTTVFDMR
jgi:hypothetical protein